MCPLLTPHQAKKPLATLPMKFERPDIIRPPSEWRSYFLPLTRGCSNNTCAFCGYCGVKLQLRDLAEVKKEIDALALFMRHSMRVPGMPEVVYSVAQGWDGKMVFLQDGDAMVYPFAGLKESLEYLNDKLPDIERIGIYATPQDILRRSVDELKTLAGLKLGIIYMGVESGDDVLLAHIKKGANHAQIVEAGRKVREAGIILSATVILGLGGVEGSDRHARETARILSEIDPEFAGALTLTLVPGTPLHQEWQEGKFHLVSPFESLQELKTMVENFSFTNCFFSSMHASNYVAVRGTLSGDKDKMLKTLETILAKKDPALLRPEFMRGL